MESDISGVLSVLPGLSKDDLKEVVARATFLLGSTVGKEQRVQELGEADYYDKVLEETLRGIGMRYVPGQAFRRMTFYKTYDESRKHLVSYTVQFMKPKGRASWFKVIRLQFALLTMWMQKVGIPITQRTLSINLGRVPSIIEQEFPGYRVSGLLPKIANWSVWSTAG